VGSDEIELILDFRQAISTNLKTKSHETKRIADGHIFAHEFTRTI